MAIFEKGRAKTGGKQKGSKNERTKEWEKLAESIQERHTERFNDILDSLDDEKFADKFLQILEYFKPKLQRTTLIGDSSEPINVNFTPVGNKRTGK